LPRARPLLRFRAHAVRQRRLKKSGERATALVVSCEECSKVTSNELRDHDYPLEVHTEAGETFEAKVRDKF
jgi:hypothetical protein